MDEFGIIETYFRPLAGPGGLRLLDDAALLSVPDEQQLVITKDAVIADVHFFADGDPALIARRLQRVNLSDLAAKGAKPHSYYLGLSLALAVDEAWIARFAKGLEADQRHFLWQLGGGDLTRHRHADAPTVLSLTAIGTVPTGKMVMRAGATPGDHLYITGAVGGAALYVNGNNADDRGEDMPGYTAYWLPEPRLNLTDILQSYASAAADISDGVLSDARHIARASACGLSLKVDDIPLHPAHRQEGGLSRLDLVTAGDDYEVLVAVPPQNHTVFEQQCADVGVTATLIGQFCEGRAVRVFDSTDAEVIVPKWGYTHL